MTNTFTNTRIEFHILQSFPVSCLNRDDVGAPKSALIGGKMRARVSSQCWKRAIRMAMHDYGITLGVRTKKIADLIAEACLSLEPTLDPQKAEACGTTCGAILAKDTLLYFSRDVALDIAKLCQEQNFALAEIKTEEKAESETSKKKGKKDKKESEFEKKVKTALSKKITAENGLDIALFGRMVANAADLNVEAAASFAHAISTHAVNSEVEFFTAVDDISSGDDEDRGAAHMGSLEYNAATYYRYISLDLGKLVETLGDEQDINLAVEAFVKALFTAVPIARQTTMSAATMWDYASILVRKGHRIQASFEEAVKCPFLENSKKELESQLKKMEELNGSLFGKIKSVTFDAHGSTSIDTVISELKAACDTIARP